MTRIHSLILKYIGYYTNPGNIQLDIRKYYSYVGKKTFKNRDIK